MAQAYPVRLRSVHSVEDVLVSMTAIEALQTSPSTLMLSMSPTRFQRLVDAMKLDNVHIDDCDVNAPITTTVLPNQVGLAALPAAARELIHSAVSVMAVNMPQGPMIKLESCFGGSKVGTLLCAAAHVSGDAQLERRFAETVAVLIGEASLEQTTFAEGNEATSEAGTDVASDGKAAGEAAGDAKAEGGGKTLGEIADEKRAGMAAGDDNKVPADGKMAGVLNGLMRMGVLPATAIAAGEAGYTMVSKYVHVKGLVSREDLNGTLGRVLKYDVRKRPTTAHARSADRAIERCPRLSPLACRSRRKNAVPCASPARPAPLRCLRASSSTLSS